MGVVWYQQTVADSRKIACNQQTHGSGRKTYQNIRKGSLVTAMVQAKGMTSIITGNITMKLKTWHMTAIGGFCGSTNLDCNFQTLYAT